MEGVQTQLNNLTLIQPTEKQLTPKQTAEIRAKLAEYVRQINQKIQSAETDLSLLSMKCSDVFMTLIDGSFTAHAERYDTKKHIQNLLVRCNEIILELAQSEIDDEYRSVLHRLHTRVQTIGREVAQVWQDYQDRLCEKLLENSRKASYHGSEGEDSEEEEGDDEEDQVQQATTMLDEMDICD